MPLKHRRKVGLKKASRVIKPGTEEYLRSLAGITGTKGKLLKALMKEKGKERKL